MSVRIIAFSRLVILLGLAIWLSIAVVNNLTDPGTNSLLLGYTLSMDLIRTEEILGAGLLWRAWPTQWSPVILYFVVAVQLVCATILWWATAAYAKAFSYKDVQALSDGRDRAVLALSLFILLWMFFICGGLWFGYWLKQGAVQIVHMVLILIGIGALILVQTQPNPEPASLADNEPRAGQAPSSNEGSLISTGDQS